MQNNKLFLNIKTVFVCICVCLMLVGCLTEQAGGRDRKPDKKKSLELHVQMALGYIDKGNRESARHHLLKAFDLDKDNATATGAMAMLYQIEGEPVLAEEQFKLALKRDKNSTQTRNNYGAFLFNQKRYEEAFDQFELAAADLAYANRAEALNNVGRTALKLGKTARAQAVFEHATILQKNNPEAYIELADITFHKNEYADAKKYLDLYEAANQHSSRSLMLGIRLEKVFGNKDKEASLAIRLKNKFPYSKEYLEYKQNYSN